MYSTSVDQQTGNTFAWRPLALLMPFQFIFGLIYSWSAIAPAIHIQAGWTHSTLNLAFSLTPLALFPSVMLAGRLLGRIAPKTMLAYALVLFTLGGAIGIGWAAPLPFLLGYSVLALGIGAGFSTAACIAFVGDLYPARRGALGGALLALYGLSSIVSAPIFDTLNAHLGWRVALAVLLVIYATLGWIVWFGLPYVRPTPRKRASAHIPLTHLLRHRKLALAVGGVLLAAPLGALSFAVIGQFVHANGLGRGFAVIVVAMMAFGNGVGRFGFGLLADWRSARFSRDAVLALNACAALLLLCALQFPNPTLLASYALLVGLSYGGLAGKLPALAAHVVEQGHADSVFGLLFGTLAFASFLGPLLGSALGMQTALIVVIVCSIAVAGLSLIDR
ncbi:MAG: MFS transporter [Acidihalobacter sp.]|uniref:MFS transporter n=1 Tax=Acidihalobacter sp. TaxID=1872108 RepID=UPI00307CFBF2